ncbi:MAG: LLM class F420-dependent oxidoreductase [candidate division NC10 bacterium]
MTRLGLSLPLMHPLPLTVHLSLAREAQTLGFDRVWATEIAGPDAMTLMGLLAAHTSRIGFATGVVPVQTRTPQVLAMTAATLGSAAPGRFALGLGVSSPTIVGQWHGLAWDRPLERLREAVTLIRLALSGEKVSFEGRHYRCRNFRLSMLPPQPVKIVLGALGPRMLELAGEIADGVLLNWLPPEAVPTCLARIEAGAKKAGRSLADIEVAGFVRTSVTDDTGAARQWLARDITGYAIVDSYARFFSECGYTDEIARINAAWQAGDRAGAVAQVSDRFLEGLGTVGSEAFCRDRMAQYAKAGLTEPVVFPFAAGSDPVPTLFRTVRAFGREPSRSAS